MTVRYELSGRVAVITIDRPDRRNAVDAATAQALRESWLRFEQDEGADVAILHGAGGHFSAGADLIAFDLVDRPEGYLGFTRTEVSKPTIAAIEGYCVAGGLEMALWCDLRVAGVSAVLGFLERRFGVPLGDGGTQRLPRIVGRGLALELILTGRKVDAAEAHAIGLVNAVVPDGTALEEARRIAELISGFPRETVRSDRSALHDGADLPLADGLEVERRAAAKVMPVGRVGAARFAAGEGRGGGSVEPRLPDPAERPADGVLVEIKAAGSVIPGYLVVPETADARPLVLVHHQWGLDAEMRAAADRLGGAGYLVLAPDLFEGKVPDHPDLARELVTGLDLAQAGLWLRAAAETARQHPAARGPSGVIGFGMGGGLAMWLATVDPLVSACVTFSATFPWPGLRPDYQRAEAGFLGHYGDQHDGVAGKPAYALEMRLRELGIDATFHTYRGPGEGFYHEWRPEGDEETASLAWERTIMFLRRTL